MHAVPEDGVQISIVIPARNAAATIAAQLDALAASDDPGVPFEVVVADNGSTDDTVAIVESFADRLPVRVVDASHVTGANVARNCGVRESHGTWMLFCDADDEVDPAWMARMVAAFQRGHELNAGPIDYVRLNPSEVVAWRGQARSGVGVMAGFLRGAHTANLGVSRSVFDLIGGFDEDFAHGGDDIEFMWRAQLAGTELHEVTDAVVHYRLRSNLRDHWKQSVNYGACEPLLYTKFAKHGMKRRTVGALVSDLWWLATRLPFAWPIGRRGAWLRRAGQQYGRFRGAVRYRTWWW
jgi:glycosyltransferase involved in cell wall biosynthesis